MRSLLKPHNALISVFNKTGVEKLAKELTLNNIQIISTGGTAKLLEDNLIPVRKVDEITGFPEILDGRVKTLNPKIHGGILADRNEISHLNTLENLNIPHIDIVIVNLYPFEKIKNNSKGDEKKIIEGIDIGGPTMIRAAAKNYKDVLVVVDPDDYNLIIEKLRAEKIDKEFRKNLAKKAFQHTCYYDASISEYFFEDSSKSSHLESPDNLDSSLFFLHLEKTKELRYGENPHQTGNVYVNLRHPKVPNILESQIHGNEVSFNNLLDLDTAYQCIKGLEKFACVIVKHNNPCGAAVASNLFDAFEQARKCDPVSCFGGIVALSHEIDENLAEKLTGFFLEVVLAPAISPRAREILKRKKNLKIFVHNNLRYFKESDLEVRQLVDCFLIQQRDFVKVLEKDCKVVSSKIPTSKEFKSSLFAWHISKFVKSNAIVFAKNFATLGIGAGQMSRIDATRIAIEKAKNNVRDLQGSVVASDAFFPFKDNIEEIAKSGASCIIQPGGSVRDEEVIKTVNQHQLAMIFTNFRHFRH